MKEESPDLSAGVSILNLSLEVEQSILLGSHLNLELLTGNSTIYAEDIELRKKINKIVRLIPCTVDDNFISFGGAFYITCNSPFSISKTNLFLVQLG